MCCRRQDMVAFRLEETVVVKKVEVGEVREMKVGEMNLRKGDEIRQEGDGRKWLWTGRNCSPRACLSGLEEGADGSCNARVAS